MWNQELFSGLPSGKSKKAPPGKKLPNVGRNRKLSCKHKLAYTHMLSKYLHVFGPQRPKLAHSLVNKDKYFSFSNFFCGHTLACLCLKWS